MDLDRYKNKKVLIMGLGVHGGGCAAAKFFAELGSQVIVTDLKTEADLASSLEKLKHYSNITYILGEHREEDFKNADLIIRNPGVPKESKFLKIAYDAGVEVQMQEGIFFLNCPSKNVIGITGTKGKTTTSYLIYECLKANGVSVILAGNMRKPVLDVLYDIKPDDWVVLEMSSWQCEALDDNKVSPHIAVVTNISEDHLNRYASYKDYALSKAAIFKYQNQNDICFLNKDIEFLSDYKNICSSELTEVNVNDENKFSKYNFLQTRLKGSHNIKNMRIVFTVAEKLNLDLDKCFEAIKTFKGVPYRLEEIGNINGIKFINDSAATTVAASLSAIEAYENENPVLIIGGTDKQLDYAPFAQKILETKLNYVLLKGTATEKLIAAGLDSSLEYDNFYDAINAAYLKAKEINGVVLLSPGAASFGMFKHEFHRGDQFKTILVELKVRYENILFTTDSRKITPNSLFIAYKGAINDAHAYIESAIKNGAKYIAGEKLIEDLPVLKNYPNIEYFQVSDGREIYAELCAQQFGFPQKKLKIIGITGTDGKTTTSTFIYNILKSAGRKVGLISTVAAYYNDKDISTGLHTTTPDADLLFKILKDMVDDGVEYLVLEITSHGLVQKRVHGIHLIAAGITNITPEHLDAHGTYEQLIKDKSKIFAISDHAFLNPKGKGFEEAKKQIPQNIPITEAVIDENIIPQNFSENYPGDYNLQNASLAFAITKYLGLSIDQIKNGLQNTKPPVGRFQYVENNKNLNVIVDFAHTENAMRNVLSAVKRLKKDSEKLIVVFGCAGERDKQKRPAMGKTASELADIVIITAEDPRSEKIENIIEEISAGNSNYSFVKIPDRNDAIKKSLELASENDWILILGKGHEQSMNFNGTEHDWSDIEAANRIFNT
jgi:UDP-N-acetylmuramoylalanine--D-glutamate ligase